YSNRILHESRKNCNQSPVSWHYHGRNKALIDGLGASVRFWEGEAPAEPLFPSARREPRPPGSAGASPTRLGGSLAHPARREPRPPGSAGASPTRLGGSFALPARREPRPPRIGHHRRACA